jgi:hypothetical protein
MQSESANKVFERFQKVCQTMNSDEEKSVERAGGESAEAASARSQEQVIGAERVRS